MDLLNAILDRYYDYLKALWETEVERERERLKSTIAEMEAALQEFAERFLKRFPPPEALGRSSGRSWRSDGSAPRRRDTPSSRR